MKKTLNTFKSGPNTDGFFDIYGGRFVAETLMPLILELEEEYNKAKKDKVFKKELMYWYKHYIGRPSPLYYASRISEKLGGAKVYFKRDDIENLLKES